MPATTLALQGINIIECGATFTRTWTILDAETGSPMNLTNKVPRAQLRTALDNSGSPASALVTLAIAPVGDGSGIEVLSPATAGQVLVQISDTDTDALQVAGTLSGKWDLEIEDSVTNVVDRLLEGAFQAIGGVTRS